MQEREGRNKYNILKVKKSRNTDKNNVTHSFRIRFR